MKNRFLTLVVAANLVVLVLLAVFLPHLMISPGKPIDAHGALAEDCFACHTPFFGSTPDKCIACHKVDEIGLRTTSGEPIARERKNVAFHQSLIEADCVACHSEHKGVQPFRPIGRFSHDLLEPGLGEQCDSCHASPGDALHRRISGNCSTCHSRSAWVPATFDHDRYFRFDRHHDTECASCHQENRYDSYTCYGCHEHSRSKIREEHFEEGIRDYESCVECHRSGDEEEAEQRWRSLRGGVDYPGRRFYREREDHEKHGGRDDD